MGIVKALFPYNNLRNLIRQFISGGLLWAYSVEKLEKYGGLIFCRKPRHSELLAALNM
jgi:hypothetical protein